MEENIVQKFTDMEIDAIGEILNISLGSSATSVSELLEQPVTITTPNVKIMRANDFRFETYEPAIGVEINYVKGLSGKNIMILRESDVEIIVGLLLKTDYSKEKFVLDEMSIGAICEVMNQMMGAAATALSQFLNRMINISPPDSFSIDNTEQFKEKYFDTDSEIVAVYFNLMIGDLINSEFISVMNADFAKELISVFDLDNAQESGGTETAADTVRNDEQKIPDQEPKAEASSQEAKTQEHLKNSEQANGGDKSAVKTEVYSVSKTVYPRYDHDENIPAEKINNMDLILSIPLQITVEIGRTSKKIKEILEFSPGMIVELDKQAGSQVDVFANGKAIAKGDVVVVDDFYGVRITEIMPNSKIVKLI